MQPPPPSRPGPALAGLILPTSAARACAHRDRPIGTPPAPRLSCTARPDHGEARTLPRLLLFSHEGLATRPWDRHARPARAIVSRAPRVIGLQARRASRDAPAVELPSPAMPPRAETTARVHRRSTGAMSSSYRHPWAQPDWPIPAALDCTLGGDTASPVTQQRYVPSSNRGAETRTQPLRLPSAQRESHPAQSPMPCLNMEAATVLPVQAALGDRSDAEAPYPMLS